jgi:hypothetical protein
MDNKEIKRHNIGNVYRDTSDNGSFYLLVQTESNKYNLICLENCNRLTTQFSNINQFFLDQPRFKLYTKPITINHFASDDASKDYGSLYSSFLPDFNKKYKCNDQNCDWLEFVNYKTTTDKKEIICVFQRHFKKYINTTYETGAGRVEYPLEYFFINFEEVIVPIDLSPVVGKTYRYNYSKDKRKLIGYNYLGGEKYAIFEDGKEKPNEGGKILVRDFWEYYSELEEKLV